MIWYKIYKGKLQIKPSMKYIWVVTVSSTTPKQLEKSILYKLNWYIVYRISFWVPQYPLLSPNLLQQGKQPIFKELWFFDFNLVCDLVCVWYSICLVYKNNQNNWQWLKMSDQMLLFLVYVLYTKNQVYELLSPIVLSGQIGDQLMQKILIFHV